MNNLVIQLAALPLAMTLSGCSGLLSWDGDKSSHNITTTPHLATAGSPIRDEPGGQTLLLQQHKEHSEKHIQTAYPDNKQHMINTKGSRYGHTNQHNGREEVMSISLHKDESLISRNNLNFIILGSIAALLSITAVLQWITRGKGV